MDAIKYDYMSIKIKQKNKEYLTSCYKKLDWELCGERIRLLPEFYQNQKVREYGRDLIYLEFRRNKDIKNKPFLLNKQAELEELLTDIRRYFRLEKIPALINALILGIVGMVFFAAASGMFLNEAYVIYVIYTVIGLLGVLGSYPTYRSIKKKLERKYNSKIMKNIDEVNELLASLENEE